MKNITGSVSFNTAYDSPSSNTDYKVSVLTMLLDRCEAGIYVTDYYSGEILFVNRKMLDYGETTASADDIIGLTCWHVFNDEGKRCSFCPYKKLLDSDNNPLPPYEWEHFFPQYNRWLKIISEAAVWVDSRLVNIVTFYDITELKHTQELLTNIAYKDQLLKLKNSFKLELDISMAQKKPSLILFDIIAFQKVNDAYGRTTGDMLLIAIRDWICGMNIPESELYRIGSDEFCLSVRCDSRDKIREIASDLQRRFLEPWIFEQNGTKLHLYNLAAIGVIFNDYVNSDDSLLNLIERTINTAKSRGSIVYYDEMMDKIIKDRLKLELSLKNSVRENMKGFEVYYQPIAESVSGDWRGVEALCRWKSTELGHVSPHLFIPEAERLSLISTIGLWVLESAIRDCKALNLDSRRGFSLNVNLSSNQFSDEKLAPKVFNILNRYNFPYERLCLEITESDRFTFTDLSLHTIQEFRKNNIMVALDDFGTGYSNFSNLKSLPINILKIERAFISDIENSSYHMHLFRAMTELAHTVNMKLVAEGVENIHQLELLTKNGADYLQGYLFSKPLPRSELEHHLDRFCC